jgi:hypothetical protein
MVCEVFDWFKSLPDWVWEMIRKLVGDIVAGGALLILGLWAFRKQQKFISSSTEVKNICEALKEYLEPYQDLFYKTHFINSPVSLLSRLGNSRFYASKFMASKMNIKMMNLTAMKSIGVKEIPVGVPKKLEDQIILYESMQTLRTYSFDVVYSFLQIIQVVEGITKNDETLSEFELTNILTHYN